jgi:hypothetical protein
MSLATHPAQGIDVGAGSEQLLHPHQAAGAGSIDKVRGSRHRSRHRSAGAGLPPGEPQERAVQKEQGRRTGLRRLRTVSPKTATVNMAHTALDESDKVRAACILVHALL